MSSDAAEAKAPGSRAGPDHLSIHEKSSFANEQHLEQVTTSNGNSEYNNSEEEPEMHARTYLALAAMFLLNLAQVVALQGPPAVVSLNCCTYRWNGLTTVTTYSSFTLDKTSIMLLPRHGFPTLSLLCRP